MFLWLKTLYRKRAVTWPFIFTQLYGLYLIIGISYHFLSYFYAKKLVRAGVQRGYDWYEDTGHRLMDPAAVTSVEKSGKN